MTSTTGPSDDGRARGFTLLELIAVLVLITTVLAIAAPSLRGFTGGRQTADAAAKVLALAQMARSQAAAEGCVYRLNFSADAKTYWLTRQRAGVFVRLDTEPGRRFEFPETVSADLQSVSQDGDMSYVQFYPNGRSDQATITLTGPRDSVFVVACPSAAEPFRILSSSQAQDRE